MQGDRSGEEPVRSQKDALGAICVGQPDPRRVEQVLWELMVHRQQRLEQEAAAREQMANETAGEQQRSGAVGCCNHLFRP